MPASCKGCKYYHAMSSYSTANKCCNFYFDTGELRGCPIDGCIHHTKYHKEEKPMPKAISQDKIDEIRAMREQGISVEEIEKLTGVSHNSISKYTKDMKNPAAAATTTGEESVSYTKLTTDMITPNLGNVKPLEEPTETPSESEDKPDVKTYEDSPETSADEGTEGVTAKDVPFSVIIACITRISDLTTQLHDCEKMSEGIRREIAELEAFIR